MHTAETGFNLILAVLQQHLQCLIACDTYSVYTDDMLVSNLSSRYVSSENNLDHDLKYNPSPLSLGKMSFLKSSVVPSKCIGGFLPAAVIPFYQLYISSSISG